MRNFYVKFVKIFLIGLSVDKIPSSAVISVPSKSNPSNTLDDFATAISISLYKIQTFYLSIAHGQSLQAKLPVE